tara:strand:- start:1831 stop:2913 length:1083 start_codon:yes stop_codon:yes gene_type:complete
MKINNKHFKTIWYDKNTDKVNIINQSKLPHLFEILNIDTLDGIINAIKTMQVRGAPLIGGAAAYGVCLAIKKDSSDKNLQLSADKLIGARPTAVNLEHAVHRMIIAIRDVSANERYERALFEAQKICDEDIDHCKKIGGYGKKIIEKYIEKNDVETINILTHCNAGWLATIDWGTATSPIYHAFLEGKKIHVWVDETRPRNQGSSLTAYELTQEGVPNTIIADNTGGMLMQKGMVDMCITGADRVLINGDVINKIGTYLKALSARENNIPFYVALPTTTIDKNNKNLENVIIEERDADELTHITGIDDKGELTTINIYPKNSQVLNLAFDLTPAKYITNLITELGVCNASEDAINDLIKK